MLNYFKIVPLIKMHDPQPDSIVYLIVPGVQCALGALL